MANLPTGEVLDDFDFDSHKKGRQPKYDWDTLLDGQIRQLKQGREFTAQMHTFKQALSGQARKRQGRARVVQVDGNTLIAQFIKK